MLLGFWVQYIFYRAASDIAATRAPFTLLAVNLLCTAFTIRYTPFSATVGFLGSVYIFYRAASDIAATPFTLLVPYLLCTAFTIYTL